MLNSPDRSEHAVANICVYQRSKANGGTSGMAAATIALQKKHQCKKQVLNCHSDTKTSTIFEPTDKGVKICQAKSRWHKN